MKIASSFVQQESQYLYRQESVKEVIRTEDGQEISFSIDMAMSRSFYESTEIHIREGDAKLVDPLVINFADQAADLTDATFIFDLEGDGLEEKLHTLAVGSAFLALDRNGDGVINDGTELFGPQSGPGCSELAASLKRRKAVKNESNGDLSPFFV